MSKKSKVEREAAKVAKAIEQVTSGDSITLPVLTQAQQDAADLSGGKVAKVKAPPKPKVVRPTCPETKKDGTPCTAKCVEGKETCVDHQPAWDRLTHEEHVAFGGWLRRVKAADIVEVIGWYRAKQIAADAVDAHGSIVDTAMANAANQQ